MNIFIIKSMKLKLNDKKMLLINESSSSDEEINNKKKQIKKNIPWTELYRPNKIKDLVVNKSTLVKINKIITDKNMPNIIITGLPGIGKTTTILCIAKALLGPYYKNNILELNASDDRGIKAVQDLIIYFCKKKIDIPQGENKYSNHKIILLDEADNMTKKAQQLINTLMETYHNTTRFAFTCNNSSEIIEAIQSRCIIFRYKRLNEEQIIYRLKQICDKEKINYDNEGLQAISITSQGDLRKAINNLQLTYNGYKNIIPKYVYTLCDKPHPLTIKKIFVYCKNKEFTKALELYINLKNKGYSNSDISLSLKDTLKSSIIKDLTELEKISFMQKISDCVLRISQGIDTDLQLTGCLANLCSE